MARRLGGVVDHDLAEVVTRPERVRRQDPDLDEVLEVAVLIELGQALDGVDGQRVVVAARDLEQRRRPYGPLEMDVELDLGVRQLSPVPVRGSGSTPACDQRRSK